MIAHVPVLTAEVAAASCSPSAAGCSSTARSGSAATRARCSKRARRASSASIATPTRSRWRARRSRRGAIASSSFTPTTAILDEVLDRRGVDAIDGALADLGVSSMQFDAAGRGFSFQRDEPLDMRMDTHERRHRRAISSRARPSAELADAIYPVRRGALFAADRARDRRRARASSRSTTTGRLAAIVRRAVPRRGYTRIDPATRTFQALRIWVNRELEGLDRFLETAVRRLRAGARLVVITFHSLEDRIVKHTLRALAAGGDDRRARC